MNTIQTVAGKTVYGAYINETKDKIILDCASSLIKFEVEGDCCSSSYFNDINGIEALLGATISEIQQTDNGEDKERENRLGGEEYRECVKFYGLKIITNKGYCDIVFRNESNGYYGGWCSASVLNKSPIPTGFTRIRENGDI